MKEFQPSFESLIRGYKCPDWFRDAKFGIWSHWGAQSVPMAGDWYARNMYRQGSEQYIHHLCHYGHPSKVGYKDICAMWKAEHFEPDKLMQLYVEAGAKYFVAQAMHHDNFFNYPSKLNPFNSGQMGPKKDIVGLWKNAAKEFKVPFGITEHLAASYTFFVSSKGSDDYGPYKGIPYDGNKPNNYALYHDNAELLKEYDPTNLVIPARQWYTTNKTFQRHWLAVMKEIIDLYGPDLLYSDGTLPFGISGESETVDELFRPGLEAVSYLYNSSIKEYGENRAVYTQKDKRPEIYGIGTLDIERSQLPGIFSEPWQTDTCIGGWFYNDRQIYKKPEHIIEMLIDIVSKNGNLLLNIPQKPDGTIDEEAEYILHELSGWINCCGEGIYDTRPWRVFGEGENKVSLHGFIEESVNWTSEDIRYTQKGDSVYAFLMKTPSDRTVILKSFLQGDQVLSVKLLGGRECKFEQGLGPLVVQLPDKFPTKYTNCLVVKIR